MQSLLPSLDWDAVLWREQANARQEVLQCSACIMSVCLSVCVCVCVWCMYVCTYVCMYVCMQQRRWWLLVLHLWCTTTAVHTGTSISAAHLHSSQSLVVGRSKWQGSRKGRQWQSRPPWVLEATHDKSAEERAEEELYTHTHTLVTRVLCVCVCVRVCVCICAYLHYNVVDHIERKVADEDDQHVRPKISHHPHSSNPSADTTGHNRFGCLCHMPVMWQSHACHVTHTRKATTRINSDILYIQYSTVLATDNMTISWLSHDNHMTITW